MRVTQFVHVTGVGTFSLDGVQTPEGFVRKPFEAFTGALLPDTPDPKAMTDNPLAISGFTVRSAERQLFLRNRMRPSWAVDAIS